MATFVMLTRLSPHALERPSSVEKLAQEVTSRIRALVPDVEWVGNYAVLGPYDYVDIFRAPDVETATKVSALVRMHGRAHTEIWPALEWQRYEDLVRGLS